MTLASTAPDPIAQMIYSNFCAPALTQFAADRPSATRTELVAVSDLLTTAGVALTYIARIRAGLETAVPDGESYHFKPTPADGPEAREAAVREALSFPEPPIPSSAIWCQSPDSHYL